MRRRWLALAVILTVPSGCDNVKWGGVDIHFEPPPPVAGITTAAVAEAGSEAPALPVIAGPILLAGAREGDAATLTVVGIVQGDSVAVVPSDQEAPGFRDMLVERLIPGAELVLFAEGARVGRLTVTVTGLDETVCIPRPMVTGVVELIPAAAQAQRFIGLFDPAATRRPRADFVAIEHDYNQRLLTVNTASQTLRQLGAPVPADLADARADLQAFRLPDLSGPSVAATFLHQDRLSTAAPLGDAAYALFMMGTREGAVDRSSFVWFRRAREEGKGAPRFLGHLDWNGDGVSEILLEVFGAERRWFAGLARRGESWVRTFQDPCGPTA
jgi:hypothetical protein